LYCDKINSDYVGGMVDIWPVASLAATYRFNGRPFYRI